MELIFLILKIILIVILALLGVFVFVLGVLLFVPIKYEVSGSVAENNEILIRGKVTYLLSLVKVRFSYEQNRFDWKFFLFGFEKKTTSKEQASFDFEPDTEAAEESEEDLVLEEAIEEYSLEDIDESQNETKTTSSAETTETESEKNLSEDLKEKDDSKDKEQGKASGISKRFHKKPKRERKKKTKSNIDFAFIKQQLTDQHNQAVVRKVFSEFGYLIRHFKFRKIVTDLIFATGDPATTGQTLGILSMIPTLYRYSFKIVPDFEADDAYLKGTFLVAGKVRLIHILMTILRLIFDKEVRIVVKKLLKQLEK